MTPSTIAIQGGDHQATRRYGSAVGDEREYGSYKDKVDEIHSLSGSRLQLHVSANEPRVQKPPATADLQGTCQRGMSASTQVIITYSLVFVCREAKRSEEATLSIASPTTWWLKGRLMTCGWHPTGASWRSWTPTKRTKPHPWMTTCYTSEEDSRSPKQACEFTYKQEAYPCYLLQQKQKGF